MALYAVLEESAHAALDEGLKGLYVQNPTDKKFYIDISADEAARVAFNLQKEKEALAANNAELLKQKGEANAKLKQFTDLGKTPDEIRTSMNSKTPLDVQKMQEEHLAEKSRLETSYRESLESESAKSRKLAERIQSSLVSAEVAKARAAFGLTDVADFVLREFVKAVPNEDGTDFTTQVFENGQPALAPGGQPKSLEQLINGFREEKKFLSIFQAGEGGGTGDPSRSVPIAYKGTISARDTASLEANLEDLAKGKIRVTE